MFIKSINLIGFRNYIEQSLNFDKNKVIIIGKNAQGKSNLLEVIQVLSTGKSKRASKDANLINWDLNDAVVHMTAETKESSKNIALQIRKSGRRSLKINEVTKKPKELLGNVYSVSFMVDDLAVVYGSPSLRRDWLDFVLLQLSVSYREKMKNFEKALSQRNSYIKQLLDEDYYHANLRKSHKEQLQIWDDLFLQTANAVVEERLSLLEKITPLARDYYFKIASKSTNSDEELSINYLGGLITQDELDSSLPRDFARGYTGVGPQRQDVEFCINDKAAVNFASQGQRRTIILALKLAELDLLKDQYDETPILLLDDVLAELDEDRQDFLLDAVDDTTQVIITTTHLGKHLEKWQNNAQILDVVNGSVVPHDTFVGV